MVLCVCVMATNFLELATTLKYLGTKWLPGKKVNFTPCLRVSLLAESETGFVISDHFMLLCQKRT